MQPGSPFGSVHPRSKFVTPFVGFNGLLLEIPSAAEVQGEPADELPIILKVRAVIVGMLGLSHVRGSFKALATSPSRNLRTTNRFPRGSDGFAVNPEAKAKGSRGRSSGIVSGEDAEIVTAFEGVCAR